MNRFLECHGLTWSDVFVLVAALFLLAQFPMLAEMATDAGNWEAVEKAGFE